MSNLHDICFVSQITLNSVTYYYCSSSRVEALSLGGNTYLPYILSVGDTEKIGNFGEGSQHGKCNMMLMLGQKQYQGNYNIDISLPWNNGTCEIRIYDLDNDTAWSDCDYYYKGTIKNLSINDNNISFDIEDFNQKDNTILPRYTVEDVVAAKTYLTSSDIPADSVGKRVPIQFGFLNDKDNGVFAKGITISNRVGYQEIVFDTESLSDFTLTDGSKGIGIWEDGLKKFFVGKSANEYRVKDTTNNTISFNADSTTTLANSIVDSTSDVSLIRVSDYTVFANLWFEDEDYDQGNLITSNIIAIDSELMLIVEKPTTNEIWVNRGFNDTTKATHTSGSKIYWCASYATKNLLSFTERFTPTLVTNISKLVLSGGYIILESAWNEILEGNFSNISDGNPDTYLRINLVHKGLPPWTPYMHILFDLMFPKITDTSITTSAWYSAVKADLYCPYAKNQGDDQRITLAIVQAPGDISDSGANSEGRFIFRNSPTAGVYTNSVDCYTAIDRNGNDDGYNGGVNLTGTTGTWMENDNQFTVSNLSDLNNRWRGMLVFSFTNDTEIPQEWTATIYNLGFWIDFFVDYTKRVMLGTVEGRKITTDIDTILNQTTPSNSTISNPCEAIAYILLYELGYAVADFDTTSWQLAHGYTIVAFDTQARTGISYGIDESEKGWTLCQSIASQFGLMLIKSDDGKIRLLNLYKLQDDGTYGYNYATTHYGISIDDIIISGGRKQISLQQTGTDRLRNVVKINYKRNNSTGEYQSVYPEAQTDLDSYVLTESGNTLAQARTIYNSGQKTEVLEIDAFAIYQEKDAERLAKWHLNDKAENHFDVTISLPYYHYSDVNSKTSQYDIGDIIYLDGIYQGITFNSTHKFVVQQINKTNQGRQIQISAKSIQPVSEF